MNKSMTSQFIRSIFSVDCSNFSEQVILKFKESLLDYIGCCYAGRVFLGKRFDNLVRITEKEYGTGLTLGVGSGFSLKDAVFFNGLNSHSLDMDDGVNAGIIHLGSPIFSLLLPLAYKYRSNGSNLMESAVLGYETAWSLAYSIQPAHKLSGYHATGTCGMLGAIVAGSQLLGLTEEETFRAFSIGCVSANGTLKVLEDGSELKPYNVAKASLLALVSLQMAKSGFKVPDDALGGARGFLKMTTGKRDIAIIQPKHKDRWAISRSYIKPYAACRYCHPAIEASISLANEEEVLADDIERIEVRTYELAVNGHDHTNVKGASSAKMSIPFGVAVGYLRKKAGLAEYTEKTLNDPKILSLCSKVLVKADANFTQRFPDETIAMVHIYMKDGRVFERRIDHPLGEPENPLGFEGVCQKFREMTNYVGKSADWQNCLIAAVENVENDLPALLDLLKEA